MPRVRTTAPSSLSWNRPAEAPHKREHRAPPEQEKRQGERGDDDERQRRPLAAHRAQSEAEHQRHRPDDQARQHPLRPHPARQQHDVGDEGRDDERPDRVHQTGQITEDAFGVREPPDHTEHDHEHQIDENHHIPHPTQE